MSKNHDLTYAVFKGKRNTGENDLGSPTTGEMIKIIPAVTGGKRTGLSQTVLGVVFAVVGALGTTIGQVWGGAAWGPAAMKVGAAMMLDGVVQVLSLQPTGFTNRQDVENWVSYAFDSVANTAAQGNPVPLLYGRKHIGGTIISIGMYVEDQQ